MAYVSAFWAQNDQITRDTTGRERTWGGSLVKVFGALTLARTINYTSGLKTTLYSTLLYSILHNLLYLVVLKLRTRPHSWLHPMGVPADIYLHVYSSHVILELYI